MVAIEKFHGTGNDFLVVDAAEDVPDRRAFAERLCDREGGIDYPGARRRGCDGVLFLALETEYRPPRVVMTLVQPDGSTAAMCGNGARCAATWAAERVRDPEEVEVPETQDVMIDTPSGTLRATVHGDPTADTCEVTVEMGRPSFDPADVPLAGEEPLVEEDVAGLTVTAVNTGVPHAVAFVDDVEAVDLESVAPPVRHADVFPEGANVTVAAPRDGGYDQHTFERGVEGETDSCGTGAVAVAAVARRLGGVDGTVEVSPPGGTLAVTVDDGGATLRGPVVREFRADAAIRSTEHP
jgi:diaminopimelate epimerase